MKWKILTALFLLLPLFEWYGLPPLQSTVELAECFVLSPEGSHCNEICIHPSPLIDSPQESAPLDISFDESAPHKRLISLLPHPHAARDRPPSLLCSTNHSLRAPPTLILA
jgi:hypothetical protein